MEFQHILSNQRSLKRTKSPCVLQLPLSLDTIAGRMLSASMLETANLMYPTSQEFGEDTWLVYMVQICQPIVLEEDKATL